MEKEELKKLKDDIYHDMDVIASYFFGLIAKGSKSLVIAERYFRVFSKIDYLLNEVLPDFDENNIDGISKGPFALRG